MIRNSTFADGVEISAVVIDVAAGTYTRIELGQVVETRPLTADEITAATPPPAPNPAADALDAAAADMESSPIASIRDAAVSLRAAAAALREGA